MNLSIIITSINDQDETINTIRSIRETAGDRPEIIVVDDCSTTPFAEWLKHYTDLKVELVPNAFICGCGPSRHIGALHAKNDFLLFIDSHMRFTSGWYEIWHSDMMKIPMPFNTVACATCLGLDSLHMDPNMPTREYYGATMNFYGPDRQKKDTTQIWEAVWTGQAEEPENLGELPAVMGACYFISKDWFLKMNATRFLRSWGCDEQLLSLKSWLMGGDVRMLKDVRIGHKFLLPNERQGFRPPVGHVIWNKIFSIWTICPADIATKFTELLFQNHDRDVEAAQRMMRSDWHIIAQERKANQRLFQHDIRWYADKFRIPLPA